MIEDWRIRLRSLLESQGRSMRTVSLDANLGETYMRDILERNHEPGLESFSAIADALGVSVGFLLGESEAPKGDSKNTFKILMLRLDHGQGLPLPAYESAQAAGMDLAAATPEDEPLVLQKGERALIPTGFAMELPDGFEAQIRPRSGLAFKHGVTVLNAPGTIDADYRGEVKVLLINLGAEPFRVTRGMRIAQMVIQPVSRAALQEVERLEESERGSGGFGSTDTG